jgi:hypothetical protein
MISTPGNLSDYALVDQQEQSVELVPSAYYGADYAAPEEVFQGELEEPDINAILEGQIQALTVYLDQIAELVKLVPNLKKRLKIYKDTLAKLNTLPEIE